jgi:hypoxanthine phosphoribosyltransferase
MPKYHYYQESINIMLQCLSEKIISSGMKFDCVVGIENGGVNVSLPISKILNLEHTSIKISFYGDKTTPSIEPVVDYHNFVFDPNKSYLICDDLTDSGSTFKYIKEKHKNISFKTAVLFANKSVDLPDFWVDEKQKDIWICFPWD